MKKIVALTLFLSIVFNVSAQKDTIINPVSINKTFYSGLDLKKVQSPHQPERLLFQKKLFGGEDIGVFSVMSETKSADWKDFALDEVIFVVNGRARLKPLGKENKYFNKGEFFVTPQGWNGTWETQGGDTFYHEIAVVALNRDKTKKGDGIGPVAISKEKLSGIGANNNEILFKNQLMVKVLNEEPIEKNIENLSYDQLNFVLSGIVTITPKNGMPQTFYTDEFFVLPKGFTGKWESKARKMFRRLTVCKTK